MSRVRQLSQRSKARTQGAEKKTFEPFVRDTLPTLEEYATMVAEADAEGGERDLVAYGDRQQAERLKRARLGALYTSAAQAADRNGWSAASYAAAELGARSIQDDKISAYAKAFRVPVEWLANGDLDALRGDELSDADIRRLDIIARAEPKQIPRLVKGAIDAHGGGPHARLRSARIMAGFTSVRTAAAYLGVSRTTYSSHELGTTTYDEAAARFYALAFGVHEEWLLLGRGASGLPVSSEWRDEDYDRIDDDRIEHRPPPDAGRRLDPEQIAEARLASQHGKTEPAAMVVIPELSFGVGSSTTAVSTWTIPATRLPQGYEADASALAIVACLKDGRECLVLAGVGSDGSEGAPRLAWRQDGIVPLVIGASGPLPKGSRVVARVIRYLMVDPD